MKINSVSHICDVFMPNVEKPINNTFELRGEKFSICSIEFYRGLFGLQKGEKSISKFGDELYGDYFIDCFSDWLDFSIYASPQRGRFYKKIVIKKRYLKNTEAIEEYESKLEEIEAAFINALTT